MSAPMQLQQLQRLTAAREQSGCGRPDEDESASAHIDTRHHIQRRSRATSTRTTNIMSGTPQSVIGLRKRKSPPSPPVDGSTDSPLTDRGRSAHELEATSTSITTAAAASYWRPAGWSDLTTDFLECITAFLPLRLLPGASLVCRGWRSASTGWAARGDDLCLSLWQLISIPHSPMRHHIASLAIESDELRPETMYLLRLAQPHLTSLNCWVDCGPVAIDHQQLDLRPPMQLRELSIGLNMSSGASAPLTAAMVWSLLERALDGLTQVRTLHTLIVFIDMQDKDLELTRSTVVPLSALHPLLRLRDTLTNLQLIAAGTDRPISQPLTAGHVDLIRSLHRITELDVTGLTKWTSAELDWLTADPMPMRLRQLCLDSTTVEDGHAAALTRLTSLTEFDPVRLDLRNPSFLARMTQLTWLSLHCTSQVDPALLVSVLSHCSRIQWLHLYHGRMADAYLCVLLPSLPLLNSLTLDSMTSLTGISFASTVPHLARTLDTLEISKCTALPLTELRHLRVLTALRCFRCDGSFTEPPDSYTRASMTPSSACFERDRWPHLTHFIDRPLA